MIQIQTSRTQRGHAQRGFKLDFPNFQGGNPEDWVFKASQYFDFHQTQPAHLLLMASYYLQGETLIRYQDAWNSGHFHN